MTQAHVHCFRTKHATFEVESVFRIYNNALEQTVDLVPSLFSICSGFAETVATAAGSQGTFCKTDIKNIFKKLLTGNIIVSLW